MTEMFGEAWSPMSVPDLAPDDDDEASSVCVCGGGGGGRNAFTMVYDII